MLQEIVNATKVKCSPEDLLSEYKRHQVLTGRGNSATLQGAKAFLRKWPNPQDWATQPLANRLAEGSQTNSFLIFLMVHGWLQPGYDYLVNRKLSSFWREIVASPLASDMERFRQGAEAIGFTSISSLRMASQSIGRLLIESNVGLEELGLKDFDELAQACRSRGMQTGQGWRHYRAALNGAHRVLFHLEILDSPPPAWQQPKSFADRVVDVHPALQSTFVSYLERKMGTCNPKTVTGIATRLVHFGRFLSKIDPGLTSLGELDRQRHIEPYLNSVTKAINSKNGEQITTAEQARRIWTLSCFFNDITDWGWENGPSRRLIFRSDNPRLPKYLPRYLPIDADRRLSEALIQSEFRLAANALLLARACGLRIGELLDLELDCVHEVSGNGAWLKVPLGKMGTERMLPLDEETVALIDQIVATRSKGCPLPHPRYGRSAQFLFTHHGRRLSQNALRAELNRASETAGISHVTPHQLRHTFATSMVNAGVSLQGLMALLGHLSAAMSLRYGRLFDTTVRKEYERALDLAKANIGPLPTKRLSIPVVGDQDWRDAPAIKARLGAGYCLRAPTQGSCPYANICENCSNFRTNEASISVLSAQRVDTEILAADAEARGWIKEADRHKKLIMRLDTLIAENMGE